MDDFDLNSELSVERVQHAVVMPAMPQNDIKLRPVNHYAGVFTRTGICVETSLLRRHYGYMVAPAQFAEPTRTYSGDYIFGGYNYPHFGHFLLESCTRLWFAEQHPQMPIVWCVDRELEGFREEILHDILGLKNPHIFVSESSCFSALYVPEPGYVIQRYCSDTFGRFMGKFETPVDPDAKIWISRSKLADDLSIVEGERELEERLEESGWDIFHPQEHTVRDQLKVIAGSAEIAGFSGSGFHSLLLLKSYAGSVTVFWRGRRNDNFGTIGNVKNLDQKLVDVDLACKEARGRADSRNIWTMKNPNEILRTLGVAGK